MHGFGDHALRHVVGANGVAPGLSLNSRPMEAQHALEDQQLLGPATRILAQVY